MSEQMTNEELHKKKIVAGILALLLGGLGIHYFYIGKPIGGIISLVLNFFTCGLAVIVSSLVVGIRMLTCSDEVFKSRYLDSTKAMPI